MNIVILGSGNIATHIGKTFYTQGHRILQVYSRNMAHARTLSSHLDAVPVDDPAEITSRADFYFIAVADQAIAALIAQLPEILSAPVVHCSGATDMAVLNRFPLHGVIYPVQSIRKDMDITLHNIPFGIEGSDAGTTDFLVQLMQDISPSSFLCSTEQRLALHTAAVFANNFSNALFQIAYDMLKTHNLSFDLLKPLILETAQKVQKQIPKEVQTGPAQRGDVETIQKHLQFLIKNPYWLKIYQQLTEEISRNVQE